MKKIIYSALALLLTANAFSQNNGSQADWSPEIYQVGKIYPGYIVKLDGDTIRGFIKADTRCSTNGIGSSNQNLAQFFTSQTDKKPVAKYKPADIKGYKIADKVYESINYSGGLFKKPNFNLVVEEGRIRLYEWYSTVENFNMVIRQTGETMQAYDARRYETKMIVAKEPTEPIELGMLGLSFAKKMPPMISDYEELARKVAEKEKGYTFLKILDVIKEYNAWAAKQ
ncbi:MAG: hypothetical protein PHQ74_03250 [Crocinitomicaceae bacterium]|nr:hypothetical protein [Crocinitomicaceae bacterium]